MDDTEKYYLLLEKIKSIQNNLELIEKLITNI